jgi:hypothetical protein
MAAVAPVGVDDSLPNSLEPCGVDGFIAFRDVM